LNFVDLCKNVPQWVEQFGEGLSLSITHFRPSDAIAVGGFSFSDAIVFIIRITGMSELTLSDVEFNLDSECVASLSNQYLGGLQCLNLIDLSGKLTAASLVCFYSMFNLESVKIVRCPLGEVGIKPPSYDLILEDIPDVEGICRYISNWDGSNLTVYNCPTFDDQVLWILQERFQGESSYPSITNIQLYNSSNWSVDALRNMVDARSRPDREYSLSHVTVTGYGTELSKEEEDWFTANLESFVWLCESVGTEY
jgi:hypothetical protein